MAKQLAKLTQLAGAESRFEPRLFPGADARLFHHTGLTALTAAQGGGALLTIELLSLQGKSSHSHFLDEAGL